jgi:hypothetical protein
MLAILEKYDDLSFAILYIISDTYYKGMGKKYKAEK